MEKQMRSGAHFDYSWFMASTAAKRLGRKGGTATATKRTSEQRSESARKAAVALWDKRRRQSLPDTWTFEHILRNDWFSRGERDRTYSDHLVKPLLDAGYVVFDHEEVTTFTAFYYRATPTGMKWWIESRADKFEKDSVEMAKFYKHFSPDPSGLSDQVGGKGIGAEIKFYDGHRQPVFIALREGLFEFVAHYDYPYIMAGMHEYVTVRLTEKGYRYFDSLPRLVEAWE